MSSLTIIERGYLEKLFHMDSGYVLTFSDTTFGHFMADAVGIDIHNHKYQSQGSSKAKKLRAFWTLEPDHLAGKAVTALIEYMEAHPLSDEISSEQNKLIETCKSIGHRLLAGKVNFDPLKQTAAAFEARHLAEQIRRMEQCLQSDPALAIGTAKELIETCCKTILAQRGKSLPGKPDIPELTKATLKELKLVPDAVEDSARGSDIIKRLLQNLGTIGNNLAELRGLYGTGHGKLAHTETLTPRHARLAVGAASTLTTFLFDTHRETAS